MDFIKIKAILSSDISSLRHIKKTPKKIKFNLNSKPITTKNVVSIDVGTNKIKLVVGKYVKDKLLIDKLLMIDTPEGAIGDGNIFNSLLLSKSIESALSLSDIKVKDMSITSNSTAIINREIIVPAATEDELETLIKYEIQQYLPINMDDYIVQYNILEELNESNIVKYRVLVVTYPNKIAKQYYELVNNIKLKPNTLDVTFNSIKKLINSIKDVNGTEFNIGDTSAFIDMGADTLNVNIYSSGQMDFTRIIKSGGSLIDKEISRRLKIALTDAEKRKVELCDMNYEGFSEETEAYMINDIISAVADEWIEELGRIIQFYKNKKIGNRIDKIYIYGGCSNLKGIDKYLSNKLNISVHNIESLGNVEFSSTADTSDLKRYLNAIGTIIRF